MESQTFWNFATNHLHWFRTEVDKYAVDMYPVQSVLQISFSPSSGTSPHEQESHVRHRVLSEVRQQLQNKQSNGMDMEFVSFPHSPLCYYTRSTYNHKVKAQKLRRFFAQVNDKNAGQGTITFFLSVPIDYLANSEAFWTEMHSKNRQDLIQNLKQQLRALIEELQDFGEEFRDPEKLLQKLENWADIPGNNRRELIQDLKQQFLELRSQLRALAEQCIASEKLLLQQVEQPDVNKHPPKRFKVQHRDPV